MKRRELLTTGLVAFTLNIAAPRAFASSSSKPVFRIPTQLNVLLSRAKINPHNETIDQVNSQDLSEKRGNLILLDITKSRACDWPNKAQKVSSQKEAVRKAREIYFGTAILMDNTGKIIRVYNVDGNKVTGIMRPDPRKSRPIKLRLGSCPNVRPGYTIP